MKRELIILFALLVTLSGCTKVEKTRTSGVDTIDNIRYQSITFSVYGFSFSSGKLVSTYPAPGPDITIDVIEDNIPFRLALQTSNLKDSFFKVGDYSDEPEAIQAFNNLKTVDVQAWDGMADSITQNQVWIYRAGTDTYAKVRIISIVNEIRETVPYGECKFQWVYQSDGSLTFPE